MPLLTALSIPLSALAAGLPWAPAELPETPLIEWEIEPGDSLVVNTDTNMGYLVHQDQGFTSFKVVTGQKRTVRYIGRTYFAKTPNRSWKVLSKEIKGDHTTFGKEGLFLRLTFDDEKTAYGIHTHRSAETMLSEEQRYFSMGCIIVSKSVLDTVEATFALNEGELNVITMSSI